MKAARRARAVAAVAMATLALSWLAEPRAQAQDDGTPAGATPSSEGQAEVWLTRSPVLRAPAPAYPVGQTTAATVVLALTVGKDGSVRDLSILQSGGAVFDAAAAAAARRFSFTPAEVNGQPAAVKIPYTLTFTPPPPPVVVHLPVPPSPAAPTAAAPPPAPAGSEDVVVHGAPPRHADLTDVTISATQGSKVAGTQGDPIKVVENLPGLARPSFGSGQLIVWGSAPSETRTYVDGVEIPALFHGSALRSTVNGDLVRDVTLTPGAYGADFGRALGGMVRVETKDLPTSGVHGYVSADTLDSSAMLSAALSDRVRVAVAGRYGYLDNELRAVDSTNVDEFFAIPKYNDMQGKVQIALRQRESLDVVYLGSNDQLTETIPDPDPARIRSQATTTAYQRIYLHYRRVLDDGSSLDVTPFFGHDQSRLDASFGATPANLDEGTWRYGLRASHRSRLAEAVALTVGVDVDSSSAHVNRSGSLLIPPREGDISVFGQPPGGDTSTDAWTAGVLDAAPYAILGIDLGPLSISPGVRFDAFFLQTSRQTPRVGETPSIGFEQLQTEIEPRIAARLRVTARLAVLAAAGVYAQPPDPADLSAVFGNPKLGPSSADHVTLGESLELTSTLSLQMTGFAKWMTGLAVRDPSPTPRLTEALLQEGIGHAYGLQFLLRQQPWHGFFGWVAYTMSRSERRDTPSSSWRLFDYDQPQVLTAVATKELGAWTFGARFRLATGLPRTPVAGSFYDTKDDTYQPIFGAQNSVRLPTFEQLDVRIDRSFALGSAVRLLLYVEGQNLLNRSNAEELTYNVDYSRKAYVTGLPILAVVGARLEL
jgi:TonB family protein